jgi:hypothetical protein
LSFCLYVMLSCVARGLCAELITRPKETYHVGYVLRLRNPKKREARALHRP